jgi:hypothetical protein
MIVLAPPTQGDIMTSIRDDRVALFGNLQSLAGQ